MAWERIAYSCIRVGGHNDVSSYLSEWLGPGGMVAEWLCQAQCGAFNMAKVAKWLQHGGTVEWWHSAVWEITLGLRQRAQGVMAVGFRRD